MFSVDMSSRDATESRNEKESEQDYSLMRSKSLMSQSSGMWGMFDTENYAQQSHIIRNAWISLTENSSYELALSTRKKKLLNVLYQWRNPSPSISVRHVANSDDNSGTLPGDNLEMSCFIDGFRIVQYPAEIKAEFCIVFCYGSRSYMIWKSYSQFHEYYKTIYDIHCRIKPIFSQTMVDWADVQARKKWFRCLSYRYLVEKSILLGRFMQSSLLESPTPGLLLEFVQHSGDYSE
jgi:hypothetical protein